MNLFGELENIGLSVSGDIDVYEKKKNRNEKFISYATPDKLKESLIYDRKSLCPQCGKEHYNKFVKIRRSRIIGSDSDLRPIYDKIDLIKYNVLVCNYCGFASPLKLMQEFTPTQLQRIKQEISSQFKSRTYGDVYNYNDAVERYKLALYNCIVAKKDDVTKGYICLKIAWLYRGQYQEAKLVGCNNTLEEAEEKELYFLKMAYDGLMTAVRFDGFPIIEIDVNRGTYICADIARKLGEYGEAMNLVMKVIHSKSVGHKLKDKAIELKIRIQEESNELLTEDLEIKKHEHES